MHFFTCIILFVGKHLDVIKYLIDEGFSLTEGMCIKFPDVIGNFLLMDYDTNDPQVIHRHD